jgi:hypothetical protein
MKMEFSKEWLLKDLDKEGADIATAGKLQNIKGEQVSAPPEVKSQLVSAFARLISLKRRDKSLTPEKLASQARIDLDELMSIEQIPGYVPEPRTVCNLANALNLPQEEMLQLSGNKVLRDEKLVAHAERFAANAPSMEKLNTAEKRALEEFVKTITSNSK